MHKYVTNSWTMELVVCYISNKHHQTEWLGAVGGKEWLLYGDVMKASCGLAIGSVLSACWSFPL